MAILACFTIFFYARRELTERAFQTQPAPARQVLVLPDAIKVNGDSLSFRGRIGGRLYQLYYKLASPREKERFQKLADLVTLKIEAETACDAHQDAQAKLIIRFIDFIKVLGF